MGLSIDAVRQACEQISREIRDTYKPLALHYIIHHDGQRKEAMEITAQDLLYHPAFKNAIKLLKSAPKTQESTYLGIATGKENVFGGLSSRDAMLGLYTLNMDQYKSLNDVKAHAWHFAWHALNIVHNRKDSPYREMLKKGIIKPAKTLLEKASDNMRADSFSSFMCAVHGDRSAIKKLAFTRGMNAMALRTGYRPEEYPFILAHEATEFAISQALKNPLPKKKILPAAMKLAREVGIAFDEATTKQWLSFCIPAQDMVWRGYSKEDILASAIYISQNTHVRAIGHLVADVTSIQPSSILDIREHYSAFGDDKFNMALHEKTVSEIFDDVMNKGLQYGSAEPFIEEANRQNEELSNGNILGWCAYALQKAARTFEHALANGQSRDEQEHYTRKEFNSSRSETTWEQLKQLGQEIVKQYRIGHTLTLGNIAELYHNTPEFAPVLSSVKMTMKDPGYIAKLEAANDLSPRMAPQAAPQTPTPSAPAPKTAPQAAPRVPGMGGMGPAMGGHSAGIIATPPSQTGNRPAIPTSENQDENA